MARKVVLAFALVGLIGAGPAMADVCFICECVDGEIVEACMQDCDVAEAFCIDFCIGHNGVASFECWTLAVPTLSQWGMIVMTVLFVAVGGYVFHKRQTQPSTA